MFKNAHTEISGTFVRICNAEQINLSLKRNSSERPEARYNRQGEDALYLTLNEESARIALRKYSENIDKPLFLVKYTVEPCMLVDLRHESVVNYKVLASQNWQDAIIKGEEPTSWQISDLLRKHQEIGLIDPSRKEPNTWHVTLFRWNEIGTPKVTQEGIPVPINLF